MRSNNPLTAAIVIASATALVVLYAFLRPEQTLVVLVVYLATIISLSVIVYFVSKMYGSLKTSVDADDFTDITEDLNSEIIIWYSDFSYVFMNKRIRELLEINGIPYDEREMLKKAFEVDDLTIDNLKPILQTGSHEASFLNSLLCLHQHRLQSH